METAIITQVSPTAVGTLDFTEAGFGTPDAVVFFYSWANSTTNPELSSRIGYGFCDGVAQHAMSVSNATATTTTSTRRTSGQYCVYVTAVDASTTELRAAFDSWVIDGVRVSFDTVQAQQFYITALLIKDCPNLTVGSLLLSTGVNTITLGYKANFGLMGSISRSSETPATANIISFGAFHNSGTDTITQASALLGSSTSVADDITNTMVRDDAAAGRVYGNSVGWSGAITNVTATAVEVTASSGGSVIIYLFADTGDVDGVSVDVVDTPTVTGSWGVNAPAFEPQSVILALTGASLTNAITTANPATYALSVFDESISACYGVDHFDGAVDTDTRSNYAALPVQTYHYNTGHVKLLEGSTPVFNASGYSINMTTVDATARKAVSIAFKATSTGVPLSGVVASVSTANGVLEASVPLSGVVASLSKMGAGLSVNVQLGAGVVSSALMSSALEHGVDIDGDVVSEAITRGGLTLTASISGKVISESVLAGTLSTDAGIDLSGGITSESGSSGQVGYSVPLSVALVSESVINGAVTIPSILSGAMVSVAESSGDIEISIPITSDIVNESNLGGSISLKAPLSANVVSVSKIGAALKQDGELWLSGGFFSSSGMSSSSEVLTSPIPTNVSEYEDIADDVLTELKYYGREVRIFRDVRSNYDPLLGTEEVSRISTKAHCVTLPASKGTIQAFDNRSDGAGVQYIRFLMVAAKDLAFPVLPNDLFYMDNYYWRVLGATPVNPVGVPLVFRVGVTR